MNTYYTLFFTDIKSTMRLALYILFFALAYSAAEAATGDTTRVTLVQKYRYPGQPTSKDTVLFFSSDVVRPTARIVLNVRLACPCARLLGEWDYTMQFNLRKPNGFDTAGKRVFSEITEIARFITPYAASYPSTWNYTWQWDITDYAPLLRDSIMFSAYYSGWSPSAEMDMWFDIIEGPSFYDVLGIERLWNGSFAYGITSKPIDPFLTNKRFIPQANAHSTILRVMTTGHGGDGTSNAAEFSERTHSIYLNDKKLYDQYLWRSDCALNPVSAQGGTWVYSRGGWCPGDTVEYWDFDLTNSLNKTPSTENVVDYRMEPYTNNASGEASYTTSGAIIYRSAPRYTDDAVIDAVKAPNNDAPYNRLNPICSHPIIRIKNTGSKPLTSLKFVYGLEGISQQEYTWTSNDGIAFLGERDITLPELAWANLSQQAAKAIFVVRIDNPNAQPTSGSTLFKSARTALEVAPRIPNKFAVSVLTNGQAIDNVFSWQIRNTATGAVAASNDNLSTPSKLYIDSVTLENGCYEFVFTNSSGLGIGWWLSERIGYGNGSVRVVMNNRDLLTFSGDFGQEIRQQFSVGEIPTISYPQDTVYTGSVAVGDSIEKSIVVRPANSAGLLVSSAVFGSPPASRRWTLVSTKPEIPSQGGLFLSQNDSLVCIFRYTPQSDARRTAFMTFTSNDIYTGSARVNIIGASPATTSVESDEQQHSSNALIAHIAPNIVSETATLTVIQANGATMSDNVSITLVDMFGSLVAGDGSAYPLSVNRTMQGGITCSLQTTHLPMGTYFIVVRSGTLSVTVPCIVVR